MSDLVPSHAHALAGLAESEFVAPRTIDEVCTLLAEAKQRAMSAVLLAGGTDWVVDRHLAPVDRAHPVNRVIDITKIGELCRIEHGDGYIAFGGAVTYWQLREDVALARSIPMLAAMAKDVGAVQIQTRGTLAGNIASASPAADGVPALMALDAVVEVAHASGRRTVSLAAFFTGYRKTVLAVDEMITKVTVRVPPPGARVTWRKVGTRLAQSISKVALAGVVEVHAGGGAVDTSHRGSLPEGAVVERARFGMASVAAVTHPLPKIRAFLEGRRASEIVRAELDRVVEQEISPIDDVRSTGEYRLHVAKALVWRAIFAGA